jgi:predicted nucleic acid-binding protein
MALIVVDSSVWIARLRGHRTPQVHLLTETLDPLEIVVGDVVLMEVLQGARSEAHAAALLRELRQFRPVEMMSVAVAVAAARNYRQLRGLGITTPRSNDLIIATYCILNNYELLHQDRDFGPYAQHLGLKLA